MKISARDEYACSAVLELALNYDSDAPVRVQDIAERQGIPMKFLFQIMQILKRVDVVRSKRGTEGGYVLARHPGQITVGDVIRSMSGPLVQLSCLDSGNFSDNCDKLTACQFKPIWAEVDRAIAGVLNNITFEELARRARANERQVMYHI
ncbi:MAG: Rrf2 family transcriptional regulator [Acidobacteria bacterium]|nr:Rrf2 family transcriptional regulator [Acidobacteriota bacterium]